MATWTMLTCEYPPECGGVGDYSAGVAAALAAAGDEVTVFHPPQSHGRATAHTSRPGVKVIALPDVYGRGSTRDIEAWVNGRRCSILVQYVPTAFGLRGANLKFCRWLRDRSARTHGDVRIMFHEPYFEFAWSPIRRNAIAIVQRGMARALLDAATQTYVSTDAWRRYLAPYMPASRQPIVTLPIPSAIPRCDRSNDVATRRGALTRSPRGRLIGHFGTYGSHIAPLLRPALIALLSEEADATAVCTGAGSEGFARSVVAARPSLEGRLHATGRAPADEIATVLCACDLLVQPYPDGVTTRRTSVMAGLINARAVLTTTGHLTESVWSETNAVALTDAGHTEALVRSARDFLADDESRAALAARGEKTYRERFDLMHTINKLRGAVEGAAA